MSAPQNISGLTALAMQLASDYFNRQATIAIDEVFPGTYNWQPEAIHDIIWSVSERSKQGSLRVMKTQWNQTIKEFQHSSPLIYPESTISGALSSSGADPQGTNIPQGVGGHTVAQSIRDSDLIQNLTVSGICVPTLTSPLLIGTNTACFSCVDFLPTQNRWVGSIDRERILFEGTGGGIPGATSPSSSGGPCSGGFVVNIAQRGIDNTFQSTHSGPTISSSPGNSGKQISGGAEIVKSIPNTTYGVNLTTYEKGQFVYPSDRTDGIAGTNVVPQVQTVMALDRVGITLSDGICFFSGQVFTFYPMIGGNPWLGRENVWIVERNQSGVQPNILYDGQFVGYSPHQAVSCSGCSGNQFLTVAPVYAINSSGTPCPSCKPCSGQASGGGGGGGPGQPGFICTTPVAGLPFNLEPSPGFIKGSPDPCACSPNGLVASGMFSGFPCPPTGPTGMGGSGFFGCFPNCSGIDFCCFPSGTIPFSGNVSGGPAPGSFLVGPQPGIGFITLPPAFPGGFPTIIPIPVFPLPAGGAGGGGGGNVTVNGRENCFIDMGPSSTDGNGNITLKGNFKGIAVKGAGAGTNLTCNNFDGAVCPDPVTINNLKAGEFLFNPCNFKILNNGLASCADGTDNPTGLRQVRIDTKGKTISLKYLDDQCVVRTLCFNNGLLVANL